MKIFAFFLPQFHEIPENNAWWGEGFTEWTNVRKAVPLFSGHVQPKLPLDENYYNLLEKSTVIWQTKLLDDYHVDGLIYYHYYFKGKLLLEKPAENLLAWKDIPQSFYFCWANHSWFRSWNGSKEVLIEQTYGSKEDWEEHFQYLLPFFRDERYEKRDNKPLFMIFQSDFSEKNEMFRYFNSRCREEGFDGIYLVETCSKLYELDKIKENRSEYCEQIYLREPTAAMSVYLRKPSFAVERIIRKLKKEMDHILNTRFLKVLIYNGDTLYNEMIREIPFAENIMPGIYFEWDNTPRHGNRGSIITPPQKRNFISYMNRIKDADYACLNAWNEWAEGMMVEPTQINGYKYLEWIKEWTESVSVNPSKSN